METALFFKLCMEGGLRDEKSPRAVSSRPLVKVQYIIVCGRRGGITIREKNWKESPTGSPLSQPCGSNGLGCGKEKATAVPQIYIVGISKGGDSFDDLVCQKW